MKNPNPDRYIHSYDENEGCAVIKSGTRIVARVYDPDPTQALVIAAVFSASPRSTSTLMYLDRELPWWCLDPHFERVSSTAVQSFIDGLPEVDTKDEEAA